MPVDTLRHFAVFDSDKFNNEGLSVSIVGAGATGSRIGMSVAKLGISNISVWDFDKIEPHNVANQLYGNCHVGEYKTLAASVLIRDWCDTSIKVNAKFEAGQPLSGVVFLLTDTMASRKDIWMQSIRLKPAVKLLIETRMGKEDGRIYCLNPCNIRHINEYEATLYDDAAAEESACGSIISLGPTAEMMSGLAVWQLIQWYNFMGGKLDYQPFNEIMFYLRPYMWLTKRFGGTW